MRESTPDKPASLTVSCPTCGKGVTWSEKTPWRPFCSERCRLIDLGAWFAEDNRIPGPGGSGETPVEPDG